MVMDPRNYDTAYFEIASVRIYEGGNDTRNKAAASAVIGSIGGGADSGISGGERLGLGGLGLIASTLFTLVVLYSL